MADSNLEDKLSKDMLSFRVVKNSSNIGTRLGVLDLKARTSFSTPHYVGITSRGVIPHLSQDTMRKHTDLKAIYIALEDFIERAPSRIPPILSQPYKECESPLRNFIALSEEQCVVLGPRRIPSVPVPLTNSNTAYAICTSVGFSQMKTEDYVDMMLTLRPDVAIGLADLPAKPSTGAGRSLKRIEKMVYRTEKWMAEMLQTVKDRNEEDVSGACNIFAPVLPVTRELQGSYFEVLLNQMPGSISGLALYDPEVIPDLPDALSALPRLSLNEPGNPHQVLREVMLGVDLCAITFVGAATDAGIALDFSFPVIASASTGTTRSSLGVDMWSTTHATDLSPLSSGCKCYACTKHHKAYVQHLLNAKEMLAWILLQVHNLHVLDSFFAGIRTSIARNTYEEDVRNFGEMYEALMPEKTGQGPRIRGYQRKSEGPGEKKQNPSSYRMLHAGEEQNAEGLRPPPTANAADLEEQGFGKSLVAS